MREEIAGRLRALRETKNLRRDAVASAVGMGNGTLTGWEQSVPESFEWLARLSERYEASSDAILGLDPIPLQPFMIEMAAIVDGVTDATRQDILQTARVLADSDRARQQDIKLKDFLFGIVGSTGGEAAVDELITTLRTIPDSAGRRERLSAWLAERFPEE